MAVPKRLGIIVPYRDREDHLAKFLPHLISYFDRAGGDAVAEVKILVVEQTDDLPFNRGGLLNAGFLAIADNVDYVCFHDVDYLPMWADYSFTDMPTRIIWWGMHSRPIRVNDLSRRTLAPKGGLGAVTLFAADRFRAVNGYSNRFYGWGFEDKDLAARCRLHSLTIGQRDGTFIPLDHDNAGFLDDGSKSPVWLENEKRYAENQREYEQHGTGRDGLSNLSAHTAPIETVRVVGLDAAETADVMLLSVSFDESQTTVLDRANTLALLRTLPAAPKTAIDPAPVVEPGTPPEPATPLEPAPAAAPVTAIEADVPVEPVAPAQPVAPPVASPAAPTHRPAWAASRRQTICLSMIVKNEAEVIERCLASARPLIDYWIIVDTGSTDGTQDVIRRHMHDIPGELHERPWVDFAHNRSEALTLARPHGDYSLMIDADDVFEIAAGFKMPRLNADTYWLDILHMDRHYWRPQLVRNALPWRFEGVLHEFLSTSSDGRRVLPAERSQKRLHGVKIRMSEEGARRKTDMGERYRRDAAIFEAALKVETDPYMVARYIFYFAQSLMDAGEKARALEFYRQRATLGLWQQEVFISLYRIARLMVELDYPDDESIAAYMEAYRAGKDRAEPLYGAARLCRVRERYREGYEFARRGVNLKPPVDGLFVESWIYEHGLLDELAICAYWIGKYDECLKICRRMLIISGLPPDVRQRVEANANHAREKLRERQGEAAQG